MQTISATELKRLLDEAANGAEQLAPYLQPDPNRSKIMQPAIWIDATRVELTHDTRVFGLDARSLNKRAKRRRQLEFEHRIKERPRQIRLLAEGDCWFQFPPLLSDIVENLSREYPILDVSEPTGSQPRTQERIDRLEALIRDKEIEGLLLSSGAREIFGGEHAADWLRDDKRCKAALQAAGDLEYIVARLTTSLPTLKIFFHGYDRFIPAPADVFGSTLWKSLEREQASAAERRCMVGRVVDRFNDALQEVAARNGVSACFVDCRNAVGDERWYGEMYPNSEGFQEVAARFKARIEAELRPRYPNGVSNVYGFAGLPSLSPPNECARLALIIGIGAYEHLRTLANPHRDAVVMRGKLKALGFHVDECPDGSADELRAAIVTFLDRLEAAGKGGSKPIALVFYAGHGIQVNGENFLIPKDARIRSVSDLGVAVKLQKLIADTSKLSDTTLVFLDCCRDDPFPYRMQSPEFSAPRGLAAFRKVEGAFVAYATHPDAVAWDAVPGQEYSPFTLALSQHIDKPYDSIFEMMIGVTNDVRELTRDEQIPWQQFGLRKSFSFNDAGVEERPLPGDAIERLAKQQEDALWKLVESTDSVELARSFVEQYPASARKAEARRRIDKLLRRHLIRSCINRAARVLAAAVIIVPLLAAGTYLRFETLRHNDNPVGVDLMGGDLDLPVPALLQNDKKGMTANWCRWQCVVSHLLFRGCIAYNFGGTNCYLKREVLYYDVVNEPRGESGYLRPLFSPAVERFPYYYVPGKYLSGKPIETVSDARFGTSRKHRELDIPGFKVSFASCQAKFLELTKEGQAEGFTHDALDGRCYLLKTVKDLYRDRECHPFPASATISAIVRILDERGERRKCDAENKRMRDLLNEHGMAPPASSTSPPATPSSSPAAP